MLCVLVLSKDSIYYLPNQSHSIHFKSSFNTKTKLNTNSKKQKTRDTGRQAGRTRQKQTNMEEVEGKDYLKHTIESLFFFLGRLMRFRELMMVEKLRWQGRAQQGGDWIELTTREIEGEIEGGWREIEEDWCGWGRTEQGLKGWRADWQQLRKGLRKDQCTRRKAHKGWGTGTPRNRQAQVDSWVPLFPTIHPATAAQGSTQLTRAPTSTQQPLQQHH